MSGVDASALLAAAILVVDDQAASVALIEDILHGCGFTRVTGTTDPRSVVSLFDRLNPDLILLDLHMPQLDGLAVMAQLAPRIPKESYLPILVLTSDADAKAKEAALSGGAKDFLTKPFTVAEITLRIRNLLETRALYRQLKEREEALEQTVRARTADLQRVLADLEAQYAAVMRSRAEKVALLDSTVEGIYGVDHEGRCTFMNRSAAAALGYAPEQVLGHSMHGLIHARRPDGTPYPDAECPLTRVLRSGQPVRQADEVLWRRNSTPLPVSYSCSPMAEAGRIVGAVVTFQDVTERRRAEVELRQAQKLEAVGRLAAGIAHEINTPIQFVGDNVAFLRDALGGVDKVLAAYRHVGAAVAAGEDETRLRALETAATAAWTAGDLDYVRREALAAASQALEGVERVATIVRAMRTFAHPDQTEMAAADLNDALTSTLTVARNELKYVADVVTDLEPLPPVVCHVGDLNQVFLNLLINAAHAIADRGDGMRGQIRVATRCRGDEVEVAVQDTGTGIPAPVRELVFDPFFTTKAVGRGTGQGLALARSIVVEKHGGSLTFDTVEGRGTTFSVRLPIHGPARRGAGVPMAVRPDHAGHAAGCERVAPPATPRSDPQESRR